MQQAVPSLHPRFEKNCSSLHNCSTAITISSIDINSKTKRPLVSASILKEFIQALRSMRFAVFVLAFPCVLYQHFTAAWCCHAHTGPAFCLACNDLACSTPCCGIGKCDAFCCRCLGGRRLPGMLDVYLILAGCRQGPRFTYCDFVTPTPCATPASYFDVQSDFADNAEAFQPADTNGSGQISLERYLEYMNATNEDSGRPAFTDYFRLHDKDGNGFLTVDELWT